MPLPVHAAVVHLLFAGCLLVLPLAKGHAQSVVILSNSGDARTCMQAAEWTALQQQPSRTDTDACTRALEHSALSRRDRAATLVNRGIVLVALEDYQAALDDYNAAMQVMPELPETYVSRGNLLLIADNLEAAIGDYDKALDLMLGRSHVAFYNRGLANEKLGDRTAALADFRQALELRPDFAQAQAKIDALTAAAPP